VSRLTRSRDVTAPPSAVWNLLAEFDAIVQWAPNIDHSCLLTEQADGVGAVRRVQSGPTTVVERVMTWEPGLMIAYTIEGLPPIVRTAANTWLLRPVDGGTSVTIITDLDTATGPLGLVARRMLGRALGRAADAMLDGLEHAVTVAETTA
jgi:carbon monoxide dehydrogenase subunit G